MELQGGFVIEGLLIWFNNFSGSAWKALVSETLPAPAKKHYNTIEDTPAPAWGIKSLPFNTPVYWYFILVLFKALILILILISISEG